jgi:O-antigen/teichoic acid export membrane protein
MTDATETPAPDTAEPSAPATARTVVAGMFSRDAIYLALWSVQLALVALLTPITTRLLGLHQYGRVAAAAVLFQVMQTVFTLALHTGVQRIYSERDGPAMARRLILLALILTLIQATIVYATGPLWAPAIGFHGFDSTVQYAVLWSAATAATSPALWLLRSRDRLGLFACVSLTQSVAAEALAVALVIFVHRTSSEYMLGQVVAQVVAASIALFAAKPMLFGREHIPRLAAAVRFCVALMPAALAGFLVGSSDRLVVQVDLGAEAVARYSVGSNVGAFALVILSLLGFIWLPRLLAIEDPSVRREVFGLSRRVLCVLVGSAVVALVLSSPILLLIWAPAGFDPRGLLWIAALSAASAMPVAQSQMFTQALLIRGRSGLVSASVMLTASLNVGLNILLVPTLGINGSAAISAGCYVLQMGLLWLLTRHDVGKIGIGVAIGGTVVTVLTSASALIPSTGVALALRLVIAALGGSVFLAQLLVVVRPAAATRWPSLARFLPSFTTN